MSHIKHQNCGSYKIRNHGSIQASQSLFNENSSYSRLIDSIKVTDHIQFTSVILLILVQDIKITAYVLGSDKRIANHM
jgi:hypothetical protein